MGEDLRGVGLVVLVLAYMRWGFWACNQFSVYVMVRPWSPADVLQDSPEALMKACRSLTCCPRSEMRAFAVAEASAVDGSSSSLERLVDWATSLSTSELQRFKAGIVVGSPLLDTLEETRWNRERVGKPLDSILLKDVIICEEEYQHNRCLSIKASPQSVNSSMSPLKIPQSHSSDFNPF